jgi:flagellar biosynthesis protein FlhG
MTQADTLAEMMRRTAPRPPGGGPGVYSVTSGKGGVGKTSITTNLAFCLARRGKRVLVIDADLNLANIDIILGLSPKYNIQHVLNGERTLAEVLVRGPGGFRILPASSGILDLFTLAESQKLFLLAEMEEVSRDLDFLLIDTAAGINDNVVYFNLAARQRLVVLTPEPTSLTDAYALIKVLAANHAMDRFQVLVNMAASRAEGLAVYRKLAMAADRFLETVSLDYAGFIPRDAKVSEAVRRQELLAEVFPDSRAARAIDELAGNLVEETAAAGGGSFSWQGMLNL